MSSEILVLHSGNFTARERYLTLNDSATTHLMSKDKHVHDEPHVHVGFATSLFWWYIAFIIGLVLLGGVFSGLTLGLMGLDPVCIHTTYQAAFETDMW